MNTFTKKKISSFSPIFSYFYDTRIKSGFSDFSNKIRWSSDWNFDSIEEKVSLFFSGSKTRSSSKTSSSSGRLGSFKFFLVIKKR